MATGKKLNQRFLESIDEERRIILEEGEKESELSGNVIDVCKDGTEFIRVEDEEKYNAINELKNYLEFSSFKLDETYEIPGVEIPDADEKINLYIKREDISKIADKAEKFETLLGIKFPAQIYQCKTRYANEKVPGTNMEIPRPKLMSETTEQYEEYLKSQYSQEDIEAEPTPDNIGRMPYPHEQVEYRNSNTIKDKYLSEYYSLYIEDLMLSEIPSRVQNGGRKNNRINDDDELVVRESDDLERTPLGQKIGAGLTSFENFFKSASTWQKIRHGAIGALVGGGALFFTYTNPVAAVSLGVMIGTGVLLGKGLQRLGKFLKEKKDNWLYGPKIPQGTNEPTQDEDEPANRPPAPAEEPDRDSPRQDPQPSAPQQPQTVIPEELDEFLNEAGINITQYREIETRINVAEHELSTLVPGSPEYTEKQIEIASLKEQQKDQLQVIEVLLEEMLKNVNSVKTGGMNL